MAEQPIGSPKPIARSLFNKRPNWNNATTTSTTSEATPANSVSDVFSRASESYEISIKVKEAERQKRLEKANQHKAREKARREEQNQLYNRIDVVPSKRRLSNDTEEVSTSAVSPAESHTKRQLKSPISTHGDSMETKHTKSSISPPRPIEFSEPSSPGSIAQPKPTKSPKEVIQLSDDEGEGANVAAAPLVEPESDEEFPELAARAREREKQRELEAQADIASTEVTPGLNSAISTEVELDPIIHILITSEIPNTKPLMVQRRFSQRLAEVRRVWCNKQGFQGEVADAVFLVFKMRKLYDVTTCKSLGIKLDSDGRIITEHSADDVFARDESLDSFGSQQGGKVHIQAVTEELFTELKRQREEARLGRFKTSFDASEGAELQHSPLLLDDSEKVEVEKKIRVVLKTKDHPDYKVIIRPVSLHSIQSLL